MEEEHRETLKKKIQILFQLGKWSDVAKLCASYGEKFGKDVEIDMIRFKSERHMGVPAPTPPAEASKDMPEDSEPSLPAKSVTDPSIPLISPVLEPELFDLSQEEDEDGPSLQAEDIDIGDPFAADELVITDPFAVAEPVADNPFAGNAPEFRMAPEPPPVIVKESHDDLEIVGSAANELELDEPEAPPFSLQPGENEPDFRNIGAMTLDAEPELIPAKAEAPFPPEPRPEPQPESAADGYPGAEVEAPLRAPRSASAGPDSSDEPLKEKREPESVPAKAERPMPLGSMFAPEPEKEAPQAKKTFSLKLLLLILLPLVAAAALWLALSGRLDFSGAEEPPAEPQPVAQPPARKRPLPAKTPPAVAPTVQDADPRAEEQEKAFAEKFQQAEALNRIGDLLNAQAALLEAKKIKVTEPLSRLEEELSRKIREAEALAKATAETSASDPDKEGAALAEARKADTIAGWQAFLRAFPRSESTPLALGRISVLEKRAQADAQQQLLRRIQQTRKISPRSAYMNLSPADVDALGRQSGRPPGQFEAHAHGGATVMLDLTSGLMWTLYNRPMAYDKAKWWANRLSAGYSGWRLPTAEEALSLRQMDRGHYSGLAGFAVWTGDMVSDQPRTAWVLKLPEGQYLAKKSDEVSYVWAVRNAVK
jgi:hypothetical protein